MEFVVGRTDAGDQFTWRLVADSETLVESDPSSYRQCIEALQAFRRAVEDAPVSSDADELRGLS